MTTSNTPHATLTHQTVDRIGRDIASGRYKSGDRIREEDTAKYGISRTVFREAIRILEGKGLIQAKPLRGITVTLPTVWNLFDPEVASWFGPGNTGSMFQTDAREFFVMLTNSDVPDDNVFYKTALDAIDAIMRDAA